jgi:hypothetical protein
MDRMNYECVDPVLGELLRLREEGPLSPQDSEELQAHLEICQACRLAEGMDRLLRQAASRPAVGVGVRLASLGGAMRLAAVFCLLAALASTFLLPPSKNARFGDSPVELVERAGELALNILRPQEREVLPPAGGALRWAPVRGASAYRVELHGPADFHQLWERTDDTRLSLPDEAPRGDYLLEVGSIPDHLPGGATSSLSFARGNWSEYLFYRLRHLPGTTMGLLALALISAFIALSRWRP